MSKNIIDATYIMNLDVYADVGTHWIVLHALNNDITYFDSFRVEYNPKEIKKFIGNKSIETNIFKMQANNSIMCRYFCIGFTVFMLASKTLIDYTGLSSPYDFEKSDKIILRMSEVPTKHLNLSNHTKSRLN